VTHDSRLDAGAANNEAVDAHMIARIWRGIADSPVDADAYERHVTEKVLPSLAAIRGHRGARVLRRSERTRTEFLLITFWDSMEPIREFAGEAVDSAVVEPEARAVLAEYDDFVRHYEITHATRDPAA
jgi:heme-degrading monooxygenase HmoA